MPRLSNSSTSLVEVVRQVHRVAAELDRVGDVLQAVACDDGDDRVVGAKDALFAELDSSRASDAGGLAEDAAGRAEQLCSG